MISSVTHLINFLISGRWDDVALIARKAVGELLQDLGVSFRGRLMMAWNAEISELFK